VASKAPVRFGILGAARIAPKALIEPASQVGAAEIIAVSARDPVRACAFAASNGIPRVLSSYEELLAAPDLDAVYIPLPNSLHCEWTVRALRAGKHVLCEKPLASNAVEAQQMTDVARETGLVLAEAFHYRYHPLAARVQELLQAGYIGRILRYDSHFSVPSLPADIRLEWSLAGGATMDLGCYLVNMLCYFSGRAPLVRQAKARIGPDWIDIAMEADFELGDGAEAHISCSIAPDASPGAWFRAIGDGGELLMTNPVAPHHGHLLTLRNGAGERHEVVEGNTTYAHQLEAFVAAIRHKTPLSTAGTDAVLNMRLIDEIYRAAGLPCRGTVGRAPAVGIIREAALR